MSAARAVFLRNVASPMVACFPFAPVSRMVVRPVFLTVRALRRTIRLGQMECRPSRVRWVWHVVGGCRFVRGWIGWGLKG